MIKYYCIECKEELPFDSGRQGTKRCRKCYSETLSGEGNPMFGKKRLDMIGENNPMYKEKIKVNCSYCNKLLEKHPYRVKITKNFFCNEEHFYLWKKENIKGSNNPNWNNGSSFEEYGHEFNSSLREQVRFRDNYKCQTCGCSQLENGECLSIHHIDYDKQNNNFNNLISLCKYCHHKTNGNRDYWKIYLKEFIYGNLSH